MTVLDLRGSITYKPILIIVSSAGVFSSHDSLHPTILYQVRLGRDKTVLPDDLLAAGLLISTGFYSSDNPI